VLGSSRNHTASASYRIAAQLSFRVAAQLTGLFGRGIDCSGEYETRSSSGGNASSNDE
jgi:hypothetical protein